MPNEAKSICDKLLGELESALLIVIWNKILERFQKTSLSLQESGLTLNTMVHLLEKQRTEYESFEMLMI